MSGAPDYVFIADDFTGASDTLATLARAGLNPRLHLDAPSAEIAPRQAFGVATALRAMAPEAAVPEIRRLGERLAATGARRFHLKICSTFDSAPQVGNIARTADALAEAVGARWIAILGGQPSLGRTCVHGALFATAADGVAHRIDRHPVMQAHPVTPMTEADLRRHLAAQGWEAIGHVDYGAYEQGADALTTALAAGIAAGERRTLFDVSHMADLAIIGDVLSRLGAEGPQLVVGASSVAEAFYGPPPADEAAPAVPPAERRGRPVLAFAGSRSPVTAAQVAAASRFEILSVEPGAIAAADGREQIAQEALAVAARGGHPLIVLSASRDHALSADALAAAGAQLLQSLCARADWGCLAIAGGDTSSAAVRALGISSLGVLGAFDRGTPLLSLEAEGALDGLPIALKGGQMGSPDFFDRLAEAFVKPQ